MRLGPERHGGMTPRAPLTAPHDPCPCRLGPVGKGEGGIFQPTPPCAPAQTAPQRHGPTGQEQGTGGTTPQVPCSDRPHEPTHIAPSSPPSPPGGRGGVHRCCSCIPSSATPGLPVSLRPQRIRCVSDSCRAASHGSYHSLLQSSSTWELMDPSHTGLDLVGYSLRRVDPDRQAIGRGHGLRFRP
jgi:hypothetical protein